MNLIENPVKSYVFTLHEPRTSPIVWGVYTSPDIGWRKIKECKIEPSSVIVTQQWIDDITENKHEEYSA